MSEGWVVWGPVLEKCAACGNFDMGDVYSDWTAGRNRPECPAITQNVSFTDTANEAVPALLQIKSWPDG